MVPFLDLKAAVSEVRGEIDHAIGRVLDSGQYILGGEVTAFEEEFAAHCGAAHCVGVGNGLDALELILRGFDIGAGDEVIVPANTYIATWLAVTAAGASVVPVEPDAATYNLDPGRVAEAVTARTRAILAVHLFGQSAELGPLREIADKAGLKLIADAAQSHGARYRRLPTARWADAEAYSFYPTKNLGALGDAGGVVTEDAALAGRIRLLRNYGSREKYWHETFGVNSRLDPLQAAILRVKLRHLDAGNTRRREIARRYLAELDGAGLPQLILPRVIDDAEPVWHVFAVRHPRRAELQQRLEAMGIGTLIHYPVPPHRSGAYGGTGFSFPVTEELAATELSLPMNPQLSDAQVTEVIESVCRAAGSLAQYGDFARAGGARG
ncbi:MAG TPA: DegT/DnrJ/EryC1/StrS family aminotransferase [Rhizomicrobium sp.]|nr:DegT/DnrJ/EryC1/StrS family aminotransferase [Rhizomicrobium sp.]